MTDPASHLAWKRTLVVGACFAITSAGLACTGRIGGATDPADNMAQPGAGRPGGPTGGPTGGPSGTGGGSSGQVTPTTLDSGRTAFRRLNKAEYTLTVRDLLGTAASAPATWPDDQLVPEGFDTVGNVLAFSTLQMDALETSAGSLADELFARPMGDSTRAKVFVCELNTGSEATCARQILTTFTRRAYRRPASTAEIDLLMALLDKVRAGGTYTDGLKAAITAVLLSPHFLFMEETSVGVAANAPAKPLNAFELATRLSYFLWSTMPDDALSASADSGKLLTDSELNAQIQRMLASPKAAALISRFATEWLTLHRLDNPNVSKDIYTAYDDQLAPAAQQETTAFFSQLVSDNMPLTTLINADFTFANARLGKLYGLSVTGDSFTKVSLAGTPRAGLLTQASFLMGNAHPDRSAPVLRGDWILNRIMCDATPPPPVGVSIPDFPAASQNISGRAFLEDHRKSPTCSACHQFIDPLGLGLENFDGIGGYRTMDSGVAVDSSGTYPGGTSFSTATQLAQLIGNDPRYPACVTKNLLTYGAGRSFSTEDGLAYAKGLAAQAIADGKGQWRNWIAMVASSDAFRTNRPDAP